MAVMIINHMHSSSACCGHRPAAPHNYIEAFSQSVGYDSRKLLLLVLVRMCVSADNLEKSVHGCCNPEGRCFGSTQHTS